MLHPAAAGKNKRRQLAKDNEYSRIGERKLSTTGAQEKRNILDLGVGVKPSVFRLESLIGTLLFGSEESGRAKRNLADRIVNSPRNLLTEKTVNNRYNPLRKLSLYLLGNGCMVTPAQALPRDQQIETSVVASYPGSGAVSFNYGRFYNGTFCSFASSHCFQLEKCTLHLTNRLFPFPPFHLGILVRK